MPCKRHILTLLTMLTLLVTAAICNAADEGEDAKLIERFSIPSTIAIIRADIRRMDLRALGRELIASSVGDDAQKRNDWIKKHIAGLETDIEELRRAGANLVYIFVTLPNPADDGIFIVVPTNPRQNRQLIEDWAKEVPRDAPALVAGEPKREVRIDDYVVVGTDSQISLIKRGAHEEIPRALTKLDVTEAALSVRFWMPRGFSGFIPEDGPRETLTRIACGSLTLDAPPKGAFHFVLEATGDSDALTLQKLLLHYLTRYAKASHADTTASRKPEEDLKVAGSTIKLDWSIGDRSSGLFTSCIVDVMSFCFGTKE